MFDESLYIGKLICEGSYGKIYETADRDMVIKTISIKSNVGIMSILELYILNNLECKNLLHSNSVYVESDSISFVLPRAICDFTNKRIYNNSNRDNWFLQICKGIFELHRLGILHGDIKPSNILLFDDGNGTLYPKICDFGISVVLRSEDLKQQIFQNHKF